MIDLQTTIEQSFTQYAAATIQSRALVDVRDGLKPSARQIFYSMLQHKLTYDKPHKKTMNAVGMAMADYYIHGDSSCTGIIMRAGQPFAMRYPLVDIKGNGGSLIESGNYAAPRYTESRLSKLTDIMFRDIDKDTVLDWRENYDNTKVFPSVLPTKGFYNIVNGASGIATGMACSVPQYNLRELNNALIYLIDHPDCEFDDIYCAPDFATGAILYNESDVKQSMRTGTGFACKLRSVVDFDNKERCFVVTEIPYGVYTNTICGELEKIIESEENPGVERFNDLTGKTPLIKIYLTKKANPDKVLKYLFKNTSLQSYFGINFTMLDKGRFPRVFTWKEMLQAHIDHEKEVYRRGFEFDLKKIENRIHIIDGLLICLARIEEVVQTIKSSASTAAATLALCKNFLLDEVQAKAVLDMKLSRLAHLEVKKLEDERESLKKEADRINNILTHEDLFNEELKNGWRETAKIFGDERRTKITQLAEEGGEPIEQKQITVSITNYAAIYGQDSTGLYTQRRNGVGTKFKLDEGEFIIGTYVGRNDDTLLLFTASGNYYHRRLADVDLQTKSYLSDVTHDERVVAAALLARDMGKRYVIFITKNGILKKSELTEYNLKRSGGAAALKLDPNDEIISVLFTNDEQIGIATTNGQFIIIETKDIRPIGRVARGVTGIKLNDGDFVCCAATIGRETREICSVSTDGFIKRSAISEFRVTGRATKGVKIQNTTSLCGILPVSAAADLLVTSTNAQIRININDVPLLGRGAQGVSAIKLSKNSKVVNLSAF